jgi:hypothetical protein
MGTQFGYWGDGEPQLLPGKSTNGMDYWGDGLPINPVTVAGPQVIPEAARSATICGSPAIMLVVVPEPCRSQTASPGPGAILDIIFPAPEHSSSLCPTALIMGMIFPDDCISETTEEETLLKSAYAPGMFLVF